MRWRLLLVIPLALIGCAGWPSDPPATVAAVDLPRYLGTWYEVARFPMWAQDRATVVCEDVTATYTLRPDGRVGVENRCLNAVDNDAPRGVTGHAYVVPGTNGARLRVSFFWPFHGDYWVIGLDPEYRWAVVGDPRREYLWVLSRTPALAEADYERAVGRARDEGFAVGRLRRTRQRAAGVAAARPSPAPERVAADAGSAG